jgi:hypothetical protein
MFPDRMFNNNVDDSSALLLMAFDALDYRETETASEREKERQRQRKRDRETERQRDRETE